MSETTELIPLAADREEPGADFDRVFLGYDRTQVLDRLWDLQHALEAAEAALAQAEQRVELAEQDREALAGRLAQAEDRLAGKPPSYAELGARVAEILQLAEEEAESLRVAAREEAATLAYRAREESDRVTAAVAQQQDEAEAECARLRDDAHADARDIRSQARADADRMLDEARRHAERVIAEATEQVHALAARREEIKVTLSHLQGQLAAAMAPLAPPSDPEDGENEADPELFMAQDDLEGEEPGPQPDSADPSDETIPEGGSRVIDVSGLSAR